MQSKLNILKTNINKIICELNSRTTYFIEPDNHDKPEAIDKYSVSFDKEGINVQSVDKLSCGMLVGNNCFDVLVVNEDDTKYIELKNKLDTDQIETLWLKFYYGDLRVQPIFKLISHVPDKTKYIVIHNDDNIDNKIKYTNRNKVQKIEEVEKIEHNPLLSRAKSLELDDKQALKNNELLINTTNINTERFVNVTIPILLKKYNGTPINIDKI